MHTQPHLHFTPRLVVVSFSSTVIFLDVPTPALPLASLSFPVLAVLVLAFAPFSFSGRQLFVESFDLGGADVSSL